MSIFIIDHYLIYWVMSISIIEHEFYHLGFRDAVRSEAKDSGFGGDNGPPKHPHTHTRGGWASRVDGKAVPAVNQKTPSSTFDECIRGFVVGKLIFNMSRLLKWFFAPFLVVVFVSSCSGDQVANLARTVTAGGSISYFYGVSTDASGNIFAAGYMYGNSQYSFGNGVSATGTYSGGYNIILVKYNSTGDAQWAKTVTDGSSISLFYGVSTDASGNIFAAGYMYGNSQYSFGNGVSATGTYSGGYNIILVKYNSTGDAQWAKTVTDGSSTSRFYGVSTDASGNIFAAGEMYGNSQYSFGNGVSATGLNTDYHIVLVKYNSTGDAQWAKTVTDGSYGSFFNGVSTDASGNIFAAGDMIGNSEIYSFGNGVSATGTYAGNNIILVKYNSTGDAQWARTVTDGSSGSYFHGVSTDASGNIFAAGYMNMYGGSQYSFGNGVSATGTYAGDNIILVKYNSTGDAQWAKTVTDGSFTSRFYGVSTDASGNIFAAGYMYGNSQYSFGNGVSATGTYSGGDNIILVKYNSTGDAQWAKTVTDGSSTSRFYGVSTDASGNIFAAGYMYGNSQYSFGNGVSATGTYSAGDIVILVMYYECPCEHGGVCDGEFSCSCPSTTVYEGSLCNVCACEHGGVCEGDDSCNCDNTGGYTGTYCDTPPSIVSSVSRLSLSFSLTLFWGCLIIIPVLMCS